MSDWISVKEQLPEDGEYVVCTGGTFVTTADYDAGQNLWWADGETRLYAVTHWMPLPAPPKPEPSPEDILRREQEG